MYYPDSRDPGRNLLFGLLAFQNNFIDRRALIAAFDAWTTDKSQPIGRVLVNQGAVSEDLYALIDGLVSAHLAKHDLEPARSLAALTPIGSVQQELEALADQEVRPSVLQVAADRADDDPYATKLPEIGATTSSGLRFQILRPLNQGGMGVVSVALDKELDRSIALKEIRESAADNREYRSRFLAEAEITGKLEHPGIIPIYGLGTYGDGRPFYAMRLIRGDKTGSLMDAIERFYKEPSTSARVVEFRGLLRRFLDVCNAVSYAHSKGVLHRDLKPDNILLGPYGETLVVDWGLAKAAGRADLPASPEADEVRLTLSGSEVTPTIAGTVLGTPEYAPPEQVTGDLASIGERSDVYGLGAVLYCLLTGQAPFSRREIELGQLIKKLESGDFPRPRQVRPELDKPLEAICLKAMSAKPADRYESVGALATDLESYLAEEPVSAYIEPWTTRTRRWARKHRTLVSTAAASLVVALIGVGAIAAIQTKARHDLDAKNSELRDANAALDQQKRRAEDREAKAIEAVNRFGDTISHEPLLKDTPALEELRKKLLKEPQAFFRDLRDRLLADRDTRHESLARLAAVSFNLAKLTDEIGDKQDALIVCEDTVPIWQKLADANPTVTEFHSGLARTHMYIGVLLRETGRKPTESLKAHQSAMVIWQKLADDNPTVTEFRSNLGAVLTNIGTVLNETGNTNDAMKAYEAALEYMQKLADDNPTVTKFQNDLAINHYNRGIELYRSGKPVEALKAYQSAKAIWQKLADANPTVAEFRGKVAASQMYIGNLLWQTGKRAEALKAHQSALAIRQKLADSNPTVTTFQREVALGQNNIGFLLKQDGKTAEAMKAHQSALAIWQKLADANPTVFRFQRELAASQNNIGVLLKQDGKPAEALKVHRLALALEQKLALDHPESPELASDVGASLNNIAMFEWDAKRFHESRVLFHDAVQWERKALVSNPANLTYRQFMANNLTNLISAARKIGDTKGAAEAERELAELRDSDPVTKALDERLAAMIKGDHQPSDEADRLQLAQRAHEKTLYATSARLWAEALTPNPKLGEDRRAQRRYNAACAAALAGAGQGKDDPRPDEPARAKLRSQALGWLKAELAAWTKLLESGPPDVRPTITQTLQHWKQDPDLAGVREADALARLPEGERKEWQSLWAEVDAKLKLAAGKQ
jgi:serine/threonine-protein kinase